MKRFLLGVTFLGAAAVLGGCPIYPSNNSGGYAEYQVCNGSGCFSCPDPYYSGACVPWACGSNNDCPSGYACTTQSSDINAPASCLPATTGPSGGCSSPAGCPSGLTCGDDGQCHSGDCGTVGCPNGYTCVLSGGQAQCESPAPPTYDAGDDSTTPIEAGQPEAGTDSTSGGDDSSTGGDSSTTPDAGADAPPEAAAPTPCTSDPDCASVGTGARCIDGMCRAQVDLCSDTTQCNVAGEACVDGICEPRCSASDPCPTGYSCDLTRAVCNINPTPCTDSSTCQGGTTCVEEHCVPPCGTSDAGASVCPAGQLCVNGGCIPDQAPSAFACTNDGQDGPTANACGAGQVCLHHDCYNECGSDSGLPTCASSEQCTSVTTETGTYAVCAAPTTLGSDCDPAQGKACSGGRVCVDGHCL